MRVLRILALGTVVSAMALAAACTDPGRDCAGIGRGSPTLPDTATIKVSASIIAIAGQSYGVCFGEPEHPTPRQYLWDISDSSVVTVAPLDSIHARITGMRIGRAVVTPKYRTGGDPLSSVSVTVVP
jgi:hypothetical protein